MTSLDIALSYAARGWPVFPCSPRGKAPAIAKAAGGNGVRDATTSQDQIRAWWAAMPAANVGIATGAPGPDVADFDTDDNGSAFAALATLTHAGIIGNRGELVRTRSGGIHVYFQGTAQRSTTLRSKTGPSFAVDFKAAGGYVIAPGCHVDADEKPGGTYELLSSGASQPGVIDWRMTRDLLIPPAAFQQPAREKAEQGSERAGDDYAARTTWPEILEPHGWRQVRQVGSVRYWCRPGKKGRLTSASTRDDGGLWVFSTSTEFSSDELISKFGAYAVLGGFGQDYTAAAAQLRADGFGEQPPAITFTQPQQSASGQQDDSEDGRAPHSSWHPRDLTAILDGDASSDPLPAFLTRDDGLSLIYRAKINGLIGESESGKTWIALAAAVQALASGQQVLYLDFEDAAPAITGRLQSLGATRDQLAKQFRYIAPDERLTALAAADLSAVLADPVPDLIILDGVNAAMTMLGLNLKDNKDATEFSQQVLKPLKRTGAAVLTVDHVTKDREGRGSYAIGAQAKRADVDGSLFIVEAVKKFGRGQQGKLKLTVSKDRPGHVRAISAGASYAGMALLTPHDDGTITIEINAPDTRPAEEKPPWRPTRFMQRISELLETEPEGASLRTIRGFVKGKRAADVDAALACLVAEGYVTRNGPNKINMSVKPYRLAAEMQITADRVPCVPTVSDRVPDTVSGGPGETVSHRVRGGYVVTTGTRDTDTPPRADSATASDPYRVPPCHGCGETGTHAPRCPAIQAAS